MKTTFSVLVTGIGGQGILTTSKVIALAAAKSHGFVSRTESRGLSQRGGSVSSEVRFGNTVVAPVINCAQADLILGLDALEAARALPFLSPEGQMVANEDLAVPLHLLSSWQRDRKREENEEKLKSKIAAIWHDRHGHVLSLKPQMLMNECGLESGMNCVMLGVMCPFLPIPCDAITAALSECVRAENAIRAFDAGRAFVLKQH
jgi:indolepyruvate ferredoxin oxidoreductase, beta subunit